MKRNPVIPHIQRHAFVSSSCALLFCGMAMGCASAPDIFYYTLDMTPADAVDSRVYIDVRRVRASQTVARAEIMILSAPTEVEYYATRRWTADIGDIVREKLTSEFGAPKPDAPHVLLEGNILRFGQVDTATGAEAEITIEFIATDLGARRDAKPVLRKTYAMRFPADDASAGAVVRALSEGLEKIAAELARDIDQALNS